jgi:predicted  nucleic acid-binding Zn ribbon protein
MGEKIPKRVKLFRLTFYRNEELKDCVNKEFDVVKWKSEWQIPFGLNINGKIIYFSPDEVQVVAWAEEEEK